MGPICLFRRRHMGQHTFGTHTHTATATWKHGEAEILFGLLNSILASTLAFSLGYGNRRQRRYICSSPCVAKHCWHPNKLVVDKAVSTACNVVQLQGRIPVTEIATLMHWSWKQHQVHRNQRKAMISALNCMYFLLCVRYIALQLFSLWAGRCTRHQVFSWWSTFDH